MAETFLSGRLAVATRVRAATSLTVLANPNLAKATPAAGFVTVEIHGGREVVAATGVTVMDTISIGFVEVRVWVPVGTGPDLAETEREAIQDAFVRQNDGDWIYQSFQHHEPDREGGGDELTRKFAGYQSLGLNIFFESVKTRQKAA